MKLSRRHVVRTLALTIASPLLAACAQQAPATQAPAPTTATAQPTAAPTQAPTAAAAPTANPTTAPTPAAQATPTTAAQTAATGSTLVIGLPASVKTEDLDMAQAWEFQTKIYSNCCSESLVLFDYNDLKYKPRLAESWDIAPDLKSITFHLRRGVVFADGSPFSADAVVFSFERIFNKDNPYNKDGTFWYASLVPFYEKSEKVDDYTVRITFSQPDALILQRFAIDCSYIANPDAVKKYGNRDYSLDPSKYVGTGPYKPVELKPRQLVRLVRNEKWWGSPKPAFETLVFQLYPYNDQGNDARLNALLAKEIDVALYLPNRRYKEIESAPGIQHKWFSQFVLSYAYINHTLPVFKDPRVRQAMAMSFNRTEFYQSTAGPTTIPHDSFWYPDSPFFNPDAKLPFDPAKAKTLLDAAGFDKIGSDGVRVRSSDSLRLSFPFVWTGAGNQPPPDDLAYWQQQLKTLLNVEAKLVPYDPGLRADFEKGPYAVNHLGIGTWGVGTFLGDPQFAYNRWTSAELKPPGFNRSQESNPKIDDLYKQAQTEPDPDKRVAIFKQMQAIAAVDIPWIPLNIPTLGGGWWPNKVSNVTAGATQYSYPWTYQLPKA